MGKRQESDESKSPKESTVPRHVAASRVAYTRPETYSGTVTTTGKSEAFRVDKGLFRQHPEFKQKAKVKASVIAPGQILLSLCEEENPALVETEDPVINAFLGFLELDMIKNPERIEEISDAEMEHSKKLIEGVQVSDDDFLPEDVTF
jgi:antitoxin PrlF